MSTMHDDYQEGDQYDWDRGDASQHCVHGKFIGSWWGPDLLCGYCEEGVSLEEFREMQMIRAARQHEERVGWFLLSLFRFAMHEWTNYDELEGDEKVAKSNEIVDVILNWKGQVAVQ